MKHFFCLDIVWFLYWRLVFILPPQAVGSWTRCTIRFLYNYRFQIQHRDCEIGVVQFWSVSPKDWNGSAAGVNENGIKESKFWTGNSELFVNGCQQQQNRTLSQSEASVCLIVYAPPLLFLALSLSLSPHPLMCIKQAYMWEFSRQVHWNAFVSVSGIVMLFTLCHARFGNIA